MYKRNRLVIKQISKAVVIGVINIVIAAIVGLMLLMFSF